MKHVAFKFWLALLALVVLVYAGTAVAVNFIAGNPPLDPPVLIVAAVVASVYAVASWIVIPGTRYPR